MVPQDFSYSTLLATLLLNLTLLQSGPRSLPVLLFRLQVIQKVCAIDRNLKSHAPNGYLVSQIIVNVGTHHHQLHVLSYYPKLNNPVLMAFKIIPTIDGTKTCFECSISSTNKGYFSICRNCFPRISGGPDVCVIKTRQDKTRHLFLISTNKKH